MKKALALILCLILTLGVVNMALADTEYECTLLKDTDLKGQDFAASDETRALGAASLLLDYMLKHPKGTDWLDEINFTGTGHFVLRGEGYTMDCYYLTKDGQYLNLFWKPVDGTVTDYGIVKYVAFDENQNYDFPMSEVLVQLQVILEKLQN